MRDIGPILRDAGHLVKMRDCPAKCGTVDTYVSTSLIDQVYFWHFVINMHK